MIHRPQAGRSGFGSDDGRISYRTTISTARSVKPERYDVIHLHTSTFSPLAYCTAGFCRERTPIAVTVHSMWDWATPIFHGVDMMIGWRDWPVAWSAVSRLAAASVSEVLKPGSTVTVLPNGVSAELWRVPARTAPDPRRLVIMTTMRLAARKRPLEFLAMMQAVRARVPADIALEVAVVGDGPMESRMRSYIRRHGMTSWVRLLGRLSAPQIREQYERADIYVSPARLESFGIAALEARCAGLPVVALRATGVSDFVRSGVHGLLADSDRGLLDAVIELVLSPSLRRRIAETNRRTPIEQNWQTVTAAADELYRRAGAMTASRDRFEPAPFPA